VIAVESRGRLGNQLFQFAFGIGASRRLGTSFVMPDRLLRAAFTLGRYGRPLGRRRRALRYRLGRYPIVKFDNESYREPADVLRQLTDRTQYAGFFQSEDFFANARDEVRAAFTARPEVLRAFRERHAGLLEAPYVCCHVRRGDYLQLGIALPLSYYADALDLLDPDRRLRVVFVGDDLDEARAALAGDPRVAFEHGDEVLDLLLIAHASAVVTSNSSFGWWGAWLGDPSRRVVAPRYWFGFRDGVERPGRVIPDGWEQLEVRAAGAAR